jgi:CDP-diacylglycerol pyrophosphatase
VAGSSDSRLRRLTIAVLATLAIAACTPAAAAHPDALWTIVDGQCVPDQRNNGDPAPCALVDLESGYAVLKDLVGNTQFLLIPTVRIGGIESPQILAPHAPNYFADAWRARSFVEQRAGRALPRDWLSLAINSAAARSQNQLHIHIDLRARRRASGVDCPCRRHRRDVATVSHRSGRPAVSGIGGVGS